LHTFALFESNLENMKSASGKRHPGEKHSPGEETIRPQQCRRFAASLTVVLSPLGNNEKSCAVDSRAGFSFPGQQQNRFWNDAERLSWRWFLALRVSELILTARKPPM